MKSVILADKSPLFLEGLSLILEKNFDFSLCGITSSVTELTKLLGIHKPDLLIIGDKLTASTNLSELKGESEETKILVLSEENEIEKINKIFQTKINGLLTKFAKTSELELALKSLLNGQSYLSPDLYQHLLKEKNSSSKETDKLSKREKEVLKLLAMGHKNKEVAKMLHISPRTIDSHRTHIMKKLAIRTNAEMIRIALKDNVLGEEEAETCSE